MHAIGVDIGGTKIAAGVVDEEGRILAQVRQETDKASGPAVDATVLAVCRELMGSYEIGAIGLAAPGFASSDQRTVMFTPNLPWRDHALADVIGAQIPDMKVVVENDANAAGWAEFRFGVAKDATDMLLLTVGTGLGGALVVDGKLVRGKWGVAAEVGHVRVVPDGELCGCGLRGCWEQYASGSALVRQARAAATTRRDAAKALLELAEGDPNAIVGPHVTYAAKAGDPLAVELLAELGRWIGEGAASVAALLDPELVVIGGGVGAAGELLLRPARAGFREALSARGYRPEAIFALAAMGNEAGIVGAADLARL